MTHTNVTITYSKRQLACQYFPEMLPKSAVKKLKGWVYGCPDFIKELEKTHFKWRDWDLTPRQRDLFLYYLGEP